MFSAEQSELFTRQAATTKHRRRFEKTVLVVSDLLVVWAAAVLAITQWFRGVLRHSTSMANGFDIAPQIGALIVYSALVVLFCYSHGLYKTEQLQSRLQEAGAIIKATGSAAVLLMTFVFLARANEVSRAVVVSTFVISTFAIWAWRYARRKRISRQVAAGSHCRNVLIVGCGKVAFLLENYLNTNRQLGYLVKGFLDRPSRDVESAQRERILGTVDQFIDVTRTHYIDEVFLTVPGDRETVMWVALQAKRNGIAVRVVPDLYEGLAWGAPVEYLGQFPTMSLHHEPVPEAELMAKRVVDVGISAAVLIFISPIFLLTALAIWLNSRGPVFYSSVRVGKKGKTFDCIKFRTMVVNADQKLDSIRHLNEREGPLFKISNDPRVTRLGRFLRKYSLDELPQLWNVLKGDMSLVGPRPPLATEFAQYGIDHLQRLEVLPGITGMWQVEARESPSFDDYVNLDLQYIEHWSLWLDLKLLIKTVAVVFAGTGR